MRCSTKSSRLQPSVGLIAGGLIWATLVILTTFETSSAAPPYGRAYRWRPGSAINGPPGNSATRAAAAQQRAMFLQQFDTDGNGQLSAAEVVAAKKAIAAMQQAQRVAVNGNGAAAGVAGRQQNPDAAQPNENAEGVDKPKAKRGQRQPLENFVDLFDKDRDGILNAEEMAAARQAFAKRQK